MCEQTEDIIKFNIRVYALIINDEDEILLSDEKRYGMRMTKFPGGGLKPGEGTIDCLKREALEEFGQKIEIIDHFYTTDFFQKAWFFNDQQLLAIYYLVRFPEKEQFRLATEAFDFKTSNEESLCFRYVKISNLKVEELSFPVDQHVLRLLLKEGL